MYHNVIVGVDGHQGGRDAVALARLLAGPEANLTLAHVQARDLMTTEAYRLAFAGASSSKQLLEQEREATGVEAELASVAATSIGRGLHELAEARAADLLVVGSCRRGFLGRVLVGNDTRGAVDGATCAVAVAPVGYAQALDSIKVIGVGYDESDESRAALALAREVATAHDARIRALRVVPIPTAPYAGYAGLAWGAALEDELEQAQARLAGLEGVDGEAVLGLPGEELGVFSASVDLLVVGSRRYGPIHRLMLGSTALTLANHARSPLLVLPRTVDAAVDASEVHDAAPLASEA
jgi:nucleotide-binding universal stress UspA family protein